MPIMHDVVINNFFILRHPLIINVLNRRLSKNDTPPQPLQIGAFQQLLVRKGLFRVILESCETAPVCLHGKE